MKMLKLSAMVVVLGCLLPTTLYAQNSKYNDTQAEADRLFDEGKYRLAYYKYRDLARRGDSFSQYRVSILYLSGKGVDKNLNSAYSWAALAAQSKNEELVSYRNTVFDAIPERDREKAQRQADKLMDRWGNAALAREASKQAKRNLRGCTGSRLGTTCEFVYAGSMPTGVAIAAAGGVTAPANGRAASGKGTESQDLSAATRDVEYYQNLRETVKQLDQHIAADGNVEIGELEVLDENDQPPED